MHCSTGIPVKPISKIFCWGRCWCDDLREDYRKFLMTVLWDLVSLLDFVLLFARAHIIKCSEGFVKYSIRKPKTKIRMK